MKASANTPVSEFVKHNFNTHRIFDKYGIDFCCNGDKSLNDYSKEKGIDPIPVLEELNLIMNENAPYEGLIEIKGKNLTDIIHALIVKYHFYIREHTGELTHYLNKITAIHGETHPELKEVSSLFRTATDTLLLHLDKEENILFPYIESMERLANGENIELVPAFPSVKYPIAVMKLEHNEEGLLFERMKQLTKGYSVPGEGCSTYGLTMNLLSLYTQLLHEHIHLENNIIFPRAVELENRTCPQR